MTDDIVKRARLIVSTTTLLPTGIGETITALADEIERVRKHLRDANGHIDYQDAEEESRRQTLLAVLGGDEHDGPDELIQHAKRVVAERDDARAVLRECLEWIVLDAEDHYEDGDITEAAAKLVAAIDALKTKLGGAT